MTVQNDMTQSTITIVVLLASLFIWGCVTAQPLPGSEDVDIVTEESETTECITLTKVFAHSDPQIDAPTYVLNTLRNAVVRSDGNTLYLHENDEREIRAPRMGGYWGFALQCSPEAAAQKREWMRLAETPITCSGATECEVRWARAIEWLQNNSEWKFRNVTDNLVTTEGPMETAKPAYEITKVPSGEVGVYAIRMRAWCGVEVCMPSVLEQRATFSEFVRGE